MTDTFTLYKLMILYMLKKIDFPLTNGQISEFILDKGYTTYFKLQQVISEMVESGLLREEQLHSRTFYHLTDEGAQTIKFFHNKISPEIQTDIDTFLCEKRYSLKDQVSVKADYFRNENFDFSVKCQAIEDGSPLIDLMLTVPSENEAKTIATNWTQRSQDVYAAIMEKQL